MVRKLNEGNKQTSVAVSSYFKSWTDFDTIKAQLVVILIMPFYWKKLNQNIMPELLFQKQLEIKILPTPDPEIRLYTLA